MIMMSRRLANLVCTLSSQSSSLGNPLAVTPLCYDKLIKKYSKQQQGDSEGEEKVIIDMERAQSTAEVLEDIKHEMEDNERTLDAKSRQGFVSHTSDKMLDATQEAIGGDIDREAVKEKFKRSAPGETFHKPRDDGGIGPTSV